MIRIKNPLQTLEVVKQVVHVLWQGARGSSGMGYLQDKGDHLTISQVWDQAFGERDYPISVHDNNAMGAAKGKLYMDYVYGRCLKTTVRWHVEDYEGHSVGIIEISPNTPEATYQNWGRTYRFGDDAIIEACTRFGTEVMK